MPYSDMFDWVEMDYTCSKATEKQKGIIIPEEELEVLRNKLYVANRDNKALLEEMNKLKANHRTLLAKYLSEKSELLCQVEDLQIDYKALLEALKDCLTRIDNDGLSPKGILRKKVAEAIQGDKE